MNSCFIIALLTCTLFSLSIKSPAAEAGVEATLVVGRNTATMRAFPAGGLRRYELSTDAALRDEPRVARHIKFGERTDRAVVRSGNVMFDGLYALAIHEAQQNSVSEIKDAAYGNGAPLALEAFQTGEFWTYVWTRDLAYSAHLGLAAYDAPRAASSLLFKATVPKPSITGGCTNQIIQDTGSGGSYPVSTDRIVWALGASETLKHLDGEARDQFLRRAYPILRDTIEQDRRLVFDAATGLYRGEQSFLDWREQTYPGWTKDNVLAIAMSKSLSVNAANFQLLKLAAEYAERLGDASTATRYADWAKQLRAAINEHFYDAETGLYSTCLISDGLNDIRVRRYDLLGESLTLLFGIADAQQTASVLANYPVGPHGPSVVWPQERSVPIYHNQAIWPFVTAYWTKAAQKSGHSEAVDAGVRSLQSLAALNLSNMENYDFISGSAEVKGSSRNGPVINSRRQLWSVAGYLAMVQDVVFGLETSWDGIRFRPCITAAQRRETFSRSDVIELQNFLYRGTRHTVRIHLPAVNDSARGICAIRQIELNGRSQTDESVNAASLQPINVWDIHLAPPATMEAELALRRVDVSDERALFGPVQPAWDDSGAGAVVIESGHVTLRFHHPDVANIGFNIYRDGRLCAKSVRQTRWEGAAASGATTTHHYAVEAVDLRNGNVSHLSPPRYSAAATPALVLPARELRNRGGNLVDGHHFENWGRADHDLTSRGFIVERSGRFLVRAEFSNGSGPVNTGITCGVKRIDLLRAGSEEPVAGGYLIMPQSGDWRRWEMSSPVEVGLIAGVEYRLRLSEDEYSRNMSFFQSNERYTAWPGGGLSAYNFVNIASLRVQPMRIFSEYSQSK